MTPLITVFSMVTRPRMVIELTVPLKAGVAELTFFLSIDEDVSPVPLVVLPKRDTTWPVVDAAKPSGAAAVPVTLLDWPVAVPVKPTAAAAVPRTVGVPLAVAVKPTAADAVPVTEEPTL